MQYTVCACLLPLMTEFIEIKCDKRLQLFIATPLVLTMVNYTEFLENITMEDVYGRFNKKYILA